MIAASASKAFSYYGQRLGALIAINNNEEFIEVLNNYLLNKKDTNEHYKGFIDTKTVYKVEEYE